MASNKKTPVPAKLNVGLLATIVAATQFAPTDPRGFVMVAENDLSSLNNGGTPLVETAGAVIDGKLATRATAAGIEMINGKPADVPTTHSKPKFAIAVVALGKKVRKEREGGPGASKYPFESLAAPTPEQVNAGQWPSFFVPQDGDKDMAKALASTVNGARKRLFGKVVGQEQVQRAKRGSGRGAKALIDDQGNKIMETATVDKYEYSGKFEIFPVADGAPWGAEYAGKAGVAIARTD